jgi:hypothetical protein
MYYTTSGGGAAMDNMDWRDRISDTLQWIYGPAIASMVLFFLLGFVDATHEAILGLAKETVGVIAALCRELPSSLAGSCPGPADQAAAPGEVFRSVLRIGFGLVFFALVPPAVWLAARAGTMSSARGLALRSEPFPETIDKDLSGLPLVIGVLPLLGGIVGSLSTATSAEAASFLERLVLFTMANLAASYVAVMMTLRVRPGNDEPSWRQRFSLALFICGIGALLALPNLVRLDLDSTDIDGTTLLVYVVYPLFVSATFILAATVGYYPRWLALLIGPNRLVDAVIFRGAARRHLSRRNLLLSRAALGVVVLIGLLIALSDRALLGSIGRWTQDHIDLVIGSYYLALITLCVLIADRSTNCGEMARGTRVDRLHRQVQIASLLAAATGVVVASLQPVTLGDLLGPIAIASLFVVCFASITMTITLISARWLKGWPANLLWVALAVALAAFGLSGRHGIGGVDLAQSGTSVGSVNEAYRARYGAANPNNGGRIYLVAAQGGGLYAAYHTASYLARRADTEPGFRENLFAISGVSGGAVGAGVYWAINRSGKCTDPPGPKNTCHVDYVRKILQRDYLSPVLVGLLFPDFLDTFAAYARWGPMRSERGRSLERSVSEAVDQTLGGQGLLERGMSATWAPDSTDPLLLLNATKVATGERIVFSPLVFVGSPSSGPRRLVLDGNKEPTLANAMVMSARFPLVTPPARLTTRRGEEVQVVDGGYFDNSGIETLRDVFSAVQEIKGVRPIEFLLLEGDDSTPPSPRANKGALGAPLAAFFGAWHARVGLSEQRLLDEIRARKLAPIEIETCSPRPVAGSHRVLITHCKLRRCGQDYTLSWLLHKQTFDAIDRVVAGSAECLRPGAPPAPAHPASPPGLAASATARD